MTSPQPATPGSDSVHAQIAEVLLAAYASVRDDELPMPTEDWTARLAEFVMRSGWVDRLLAEAKAEALEEAADDWELRGLTLTARELRARAAAYRTNPSSEETQRGR